MNKQEMRFVLEIKEKLIKTEIYCDDANLFTGDSVYFIGEKDKSRHFIGSDRETCCLDYIEYQLGLYGKEQPNHERMRRELIANKDKYLEKYRKFWDALHKKAFVLEENIPTQGVCVVYTKNSPSDSVLRSENVVIVREEEKESLEHKIFSVRKNKKIINYTCNVPFDYKKVTTEFNEVLEPLPYPILEVDFVPSKDDKLALLQLTTAQTDYFRKLKTHNFVGSGSGQGVALLINEKIAGVFGYNSAFADYFGSVDSNVLFLQYCIGVSNMNKKIKVSKLLDVIALWEKACHIGLKDYDKVRFDSVASTCISKYPENKAVRYLMDLVTKEYNPKTGMYRLVYQCKMTKQASLEEIYQKWLKNAGF